MSENLSIGRADFDITPPLGVMLQGSISRNRPAHRVMDELHGRLLLLQSGGKRYALYTCDLLEFSNEFVEKLRSELQERHGLPPQNVMLCPSHTHTGPAVIRLGSLGPDPDYLSQLLRKMSGAVLAAEEDLQEAGVSVGRGSAPGVGINRRLPTENGIRQLPNPDGPVDAEVLAIRFDDAGGKPLACLVNSATHPTTLGIQVAEVSADYPGRMRRIVERAYGGGFQVCFLQGACGDVKAAAIGEDGNFKEGEEEDVERLGRILAGELLKVLELSRRIEAPEITSLSRKISFPFRDLPGTPEFARLKSFHQREAERWSKPEEGRRMDWEDHHIDRAAMHQDMARWAARMETLAAAGRLLPGQEGELQAIRLGSGIALLGVPGELFSAIGMEIKRSSPFPYTFLCGYSNGTLGYLPSRAAVREGGYEVADAYKLYGFPACFSEQTEEILTRETGRLLQDLLETGMQGGNP